MPNHITNIVRLSGNDSDVQKLLSSVRSDESEFDFNQIASMPDELRDTTAPTYIISEEAYARKERGITKKMSDDLKKKYGADNWYDWTCNNWGTKWNAYEVYVDGDEISFDTAWSTPEPIFRKLSEQHPDVLIHVQYADEDFGYNVGEYKFKGGLLISENIPEGGTEKAIKMAMYITGDDEHYLYEAPCDWDESDMDSDWADAITEIIHERGIVNKHYPKFLLQKLEQMAVDDEQYENAKEIREIINNIEE
jgi:hypothetical protein